MKRHCNKCHQERIVCKHILCETCDESEGFECFAQVPGIRLPESKRLHEERAGMIQ